MAIKPYEGTELQKLIEKRVADLAGVKTQRDITLEAGYPKMTSIVSMLKSGEAKLSLDRVAGMAKALEVDETELMHLTLKQHYGDSPDVISILDHAFSARKKRGPVANETAWINILQEIGLTQRAPTDTDKGILIEAFASAEHQV